MSAFSEDIEVRGHLIDSGILDRIFGAVMDTDGEFDILDISIGRRKTDTSFVRLKIRADTKKQLAKTLEEVYRRGAVRTRHNEVVLERAARNMVMPDGFYSTTNNRTDVFYKNAWRRVENMMMDKCIRISNGRASCVPIRDVKKGDMIVVGDSGVKVTPPERPRESANVFEFMGSSGSSERPTRHIARQVALDIKKTRDAGGKIVLVGGPAIVHTGAAPAVASMVRDGYIHGVLAGNALAVHDIEYATLGTSLGMNVHDGTLAIRGHRNHMETINAVFKAGSIRKMVSSKKLKSGIMYECIRNGVPFVLAPSIRDDGPLPDVVTEITEAQKRYKSVLRGAKMVIMVSTMLHSIATGNMLPADVKVVVVDINQPTVTKLMDRGTWQALGIVTDVGAFLPLVADEIKAQNS